jgi:hypothetical protein
VSFPNTQQFFLYRLITVHTTLSRQLWGRRGQGTCYCQAGTVAWPGGARCRACSEGTFCAKICDELKLPVQAASPWAAVELSYDRCPIEPLAGQTPGARTCDERVLLCGMVLLHNAYIFCCLCHRIGEDQADRLQVLDQQLDPAHVVVKGIPRSDRRALTLWCIPGLVRLRFPGVVW